MQVRPGAGTSQTYPRKALGFRYPCQFGKTSVVREKGPGGRRALGKRRWPSGLHVLIMGSSCGPRAAQAMKNWLCRGRTGEDVHHILLLPTGLADGLGQEVSLPYRFTKRIRPGRRVPPLLRFGGRRTRRSVKDASKLLANCIFSLKIQLAICNMQLNLISAIKSIGEMIRIHSP